MIYAVVGYDVKNLSQAVTGNSPKKAIRGQFSKTATNKAQPMVCVSRANPDTYSLSSGSLNSLTLIEALKD